MGDGTLDEACNEHRIVLARVRSTRPPVPARLGFVPGRVGLGPPNGDGGPRPTLQPAIFFLDPEEGVAKGQACVLYDETDETRLLGGGFISETIPADARIAT